MRYSKLVMTLAVVVLCVSSAVAGDRTSGSASIGEMLQIDRSHYIERLQELSDSDEMLLAKSDDFNDFPTFGEAVYSVEHRSIAKAFLYSALVPGLGEYYAGSKIKAAAFFAVEAIIWTQYVSKHNSGVDMEDEFEAFARQNWSPTSYTEWLVEEHNVIDDQDTSVSFTHALPDVQNQQFFEMIGKYDQFRAGWSDFDEEQDSAYVSPLRRNYNVMRDDANNELNAARTWAMVSLANHFLSALDAAITAKRFNDNRDVFSEVDVKARLAKYYDERIPQIMFTYKFF